MDHEDILLIHMGGLGDMCLSESTFLSLSHQFQKNISALGYLRFFNFFKEYFKTINNIESARWLYLFSDYTTEQTWKRIVFVGKDKNGVLRKRWKAVSRDEMIFVDMYPDNTYGPVDSEAGALTSKIENYQLKNVMHIESYQLTQLEQCGIKPLKKNIKALPRNRVILYPEASITKSKWHYENFIELYYTLKGHGVETHIFESFGLNLPIAEKIVIEDLADVKTFFDSGGIFVSNDSGMAHFAGFCGLLTITIFSDFDSSIWHPRGENISLRLGYDNVVATELVDTIYRCLAEETE